MTVFYQYLLALVLVSPLSAAVKEVPWSRSGDGRWALFYAKDGYEAKLIDFVKSPAKIHAMGVTRFASHASPFGVSDVQLLDHGYIAVNTYGALCHPPFQELPEDLQQKAIVGADLYFLFHADPTGAVKFVGFCH